MTKLTLEEILEGKVQRCLIFDEIDYSIQEELVDFSVKETALARAHRRWGMKEIEEPDQC
jgi:hypothetical protein